MFEYINPTRNRIAIIFYCGLVPVGLFWILRESALAAFLLQVYVISAGVFLFYPFTIRRQNVKQWWFWKRMLLGAAVPHPLVLTGLWYVDSKYPVLVTGTGTVFFIAFVIGVIEVIVVGEIVDRAWTDLLP
jgi:hypothetical protein